MGEHEKKFGKVRYIEPNDFLEKKMFPKNKTLHNLTYPYEDYCISVDLIVEIPDRNEGVKIGNNVYQTTDGKNENISFFNGVNFNGDENYLTDAPGTVVYRDILNNDIDNFKENLGITSINITYNSYFYPEITMNVTDIRGGSLMMPSEENYRREQINIEAYNKSKLEGKSYSPVYTENVKSFFSSLFSFPYPEFKLRVKGFYGKKIEYSLLVSDFRSSFNSQTGNFDATIKFIGKMYGIYTDIPMSYLLIAPYCRYGSDDNKTIWQEKGFMFKDENGSDDCPMPTFLELREKIASSNVNLKNQFDIKTVFAYQKLNNKKDLLLEVKSNYNLLMNTIRRIKESSKTQIYYDDKIILFKEDYENTHLDSIISDFISSIKKYNDEYYGETISFLPGLDSSFKGIKTMNNLIHFKRNKENSNYFNFKTITIVDWRLNDLDNFKKDQQEYIQKYLGDILRKTDKIENTFTDIGTYKLRLIYLDNLIENIDEIVKKTGDEIENIEKILSREGNENLRKLLGFNPTIKNIFHLLMAHLNVFIDIYTTFISNVTGVNSRKINDINIRVDELPDIPKSLYNVNNLQIPPFPAIKNIDTNQYCYPPLTSKMEEKNFINSMFNSTFDLLEEIQRSNKLIEQIYSNDIEFIPTCLVDFDDGDNPYKNIHIKGLDIGELFTIFGIRCIMRFILEKEETFEEDEEEDIEEEDKESEEDTDEESGNVNERVGTIDATTFGKLEAYNFWRVNKSLKIDDCYKINNDNFKDYNFIGYLLHISGETATKNTSATYYYNENGDTCYKPMKQLITLEKKVKSKRIYYPPADLYFQFFNLEEIETYTGLTLCNNTTYQSSFKDISSYIKNYKSDDFKTSFVTGDEPTLFQKKFEDVKILTGDYVNALHISRPYEHIKFLNDYKYENLIEEIGNTDLSKVCEDTSVIVEKRTEELQNRFLKFDKPRHNIFFGKMEYEYLKVPYMMHDDYGEFNAYTKNNSIYLNDAYKNNFDGVDLERLCYFTDEYDRRFIFEKSLKPERFLCNIPFNLMSLGESILSGNRIIDIPYSECLFIGMCMKKMKECKDREEFEDFLQKNYFSYIKDLGEYKWGDMLRFYYYIYIIFNCLMRHKNGSCHNTLSDKERKRLKDYVEDKEWWNTDFVFNHLGENMVLDKIFENKEEGWYDIDCLNLIKMYEDWCDNENPGGWKYFLNEYKLNYKIKNAKPGDSKYDVINDFFEGLDGLYGDAKEGTKKEFDKRLNEYFSREGETTAFTDRYLFAEHIDKGGQDTDYVFFIFNKNFYAYQHLNNFFKKTKKLLLPYQMTSYNFVSDRSNFNQAFNSFKNTLLSLYEINTENVLKNDNGDIDLKYDITEESKLSMYLTLKNLYDKHFCGLEVNKFDLSDKENEFKRFHFLDTFYNDISNKLIFNLDVIIEVLDILVSGKNNLDTILSPDMSVYSFMSLLCEKHNMMLLSLPIFSGKDAEGLEDMFTPLPYKESMDFQKGPTYICFYPHQPSKHLDNPTSQYENDGFNIDDNDLNGTGIWEGSANFDDFDNNYTIPAFGVEFGSQKQSIFKSINVNMDNPQVTEVSVANQFALAGKGGNDVRKVGFEGQDLFKIYSNHSYTCQVEMMGCAQIQPLMYFQLNNIPLFRGAYQIINVEHSITPGNMSTTFKGVRINRTKMPLVEECISLTNMRNFLTEISTDELRESGVDYREYIPPIIETNSSYQMDLDLDLEITLEKIKTEYPNNIYFSNGQEKQFNRLNPDLRKLIYSIVKDLNNISNNDKKMGIWITSSSRDAVINGSKKSDHLINAESPSPRRKELFDKNGTPYTQLGCAIDFIGALNGKLDKGETSIDIFNLIACNYYQYIRQLIWEVKGANISQDSISNCIHLASYGEHPNKSDKCEIYVASDTTSPKFSGRSLGSKNLPNSFLAIKKNVESKTNNVQWNNFA